MEKDKAFISEELKNRTTTRQQQPAWNPCGFMTEMSTNELNCGTEQGGNYFFNPNWDNSMDQSDPFESALSSMVSSPAASNVGSGENVMMRELIGRLGNICNSKDIITNSTNVSCYSTPLNSPPFSTDPGFAERAARFSCFGGLNDPLRDSLKLSGHVNGSQTINNSTLSRSSSPENAESGVSKEESSVSEQLPGGNTKKRKSIPRGKAKETPSPATVDAKVAAENNDESNAKRSKQNGTVKASNKEDSKPAEPPKDYIHVRARRGQATDSHSLAERVRREKISERMKFLQDLVPGCNKVTGKAVMLDEIINYVQSLQRQVEFLSMKLATVNPRMDVNMETLLSKDMFQSRGLLAHAVYSMEPTFSFGYQPQQGLALNNGIANTTSQQGFQLPQVNGFIDGNPQVGSIWEDDLQSIVQMGFGQNQAQCYQGSIAPGQVKIEL